jgi:hypothetical protein
VIVLAFLVSTSAWADSQFRARRMTRGDVPSGKGQCDIRLQVDDQVEVSVRGDTVSLRTLSGREARDDGSECNLPLPNREIRGFTFEIKDRRNEIRLVQEPDGRNGSTVVVLIHDTDGGYGRYHFRLSWIDGAGPGPDTAHPPGDGFTWNNATHYTGRGAGTAVYDDADARHLFDVSLDLDRTGHARVAIRGERGSTVVLNGMLIGREGDRLKIDAVTEDHRLHGTLYVSVQDGANTVGSMDMEATDGRQHLRVHWDRR